MARSLTSPASPVAAPAPHVDAPLGLSDEARVRFAWISVACGTIWALRILLASRGVLHGDAIHHFVISREAWHFPSLMLHHWGRPVDTILYMVPARFGLEYARLMSVAVATLTVLMTFLLARQLRVAYAFVVPLFLWFQPWFMAWSVQPAMTEIPFSLMMVLSAFLFVTNRMLLASVVISLFPLIRMEALGLTVLWVAVCVWRRAWSAAVVASVTIVLYGALYHAVFGQLPESGDPLNPLLLFTQKPYYSHLAHLQPWRLYRWLTYPKLLAFGAGLPLAALAIYGLPQLAATRARLAVLAWYGTYAAAHVALYRLRVEGNAEPRYWLPLAPAVSIAAALGLQALATQVGAWLSRRRGLSVSSPRLGNAILALAIAAACVGGLFVTPVPRDPADAAVESAVAWLRQERLTDRPRVPVPSVWFAYYVPRYFEPEVHAPPPPLADWPPGSIAVWDSQFAEDWDLPWAALASSHKWQPLKTFDVGKARVVIWQKQLP